MKAQVLTFPNYMGNGTYTVRAYVNGPLAIIKRGNVWQIIQTATGTVVAHRMSCRLLADAKAKLTKIQALPCDWSRDSLHEIAQTGGMTINDLGRFIRAMDE